MSAESVDIAIAPNGQKYVAYENLSTEWWGWRVLVKQFSNWSWDGVGAALTNASDVSDLSIEISQDGILYVAYREEWDPRVKMYSWSSWQEIWSFDSGVTELKLAIASDGTPYIAYNAGGYPHVKRYVGNTWQMVHFDSGYSQVFNLALAIGPDDMPVIAFRESTDSSSVAVMKFDGSDFVMVWTPEFSGILGISLAVANNGTIFMSYVDMENEEALKVAYFDSVSSQWLVLGTSVTDPYIAGHPSLIVDSAGVPYVAYRDGSTANSSSSSLTIASFTGGVWSYPAGRGWNGGQEILWPYMAIAPSGGLYVAFIEADEARVMYINDVLPEESEQSGPSENTTSVSFSLLPGNVAIDIPTAVVFPTMSVSNSARQLNVQTIPFSLTDLKGAAAGYYVTISVTDLSNGNGGVIPKTNILANVSWASVALIAGTANSSVTVPNSAGTIGNGYVSIGSAQTLLQRSSGGNKLGQYGISLDLQINVPAYKPSGNYTWTISFTLIEN